MRAARCCLRDDARARSLGFRSEASDFRSLLARMLLHVAAVTVLVNIAIMELDSLYSPADEFLDPSRSEVTSETCRNVPFGITEIIPSYSDL